MKNLSKTDYAIMIALTLVFSLLVFYKLGSFTAPESFLCLKPDDSDKIRIVSVFDEPVYISKVYAYFGIKSGKEASLSTSLASEKGWEQVNNVFNIDGTFCWKIMEVNRECRFLGFIAEALYEDFNIGELIFLDENGEIVRPSNADKYTELFDEQEKFVETPTYYDDTYFDEVYHGRTAYEFVHNLRIYETTHPPLGKTLIALGVRAFGMTPFGRRVVCAIFASAMVPLVYVILAGMLKKTAEAAFGTLLLLTEFMNYTLGRIATVDIIVAFFILLLFYYMYRFAEALEYKEELKQQMLWLFLAGIAAGLAIATKWTGFYAIAGIAVIYFIQVYEYIGGIKGVIKNKAYLIRLFSFSVLCFIVIPFSIYTVSYIEFLPTHEGEKLLKVMWDNSSYILSYHSAVNDEHPYASAWYTWLFDLEPLLDSYTGLEGGRASIISTFFNPVVCYAGLIAFFHNIYLWFWKKNKNARFLVIVYLAMLLPWVFITRTVFIYQYFVPSLILIFLIVNSVAVLKKREEIMIGLAMISIIIFALFFPVISGRAVSLDYVLRYLKWFPKWIYQ